MSLKESVEKRQHLAAEIRALADKQASWTAEDNTKWEQVNAAYDEARKEEQAEIEKAQAANAVQERLSQIEADHKADLNGKRIGVDAGERREANPEFRVQSAADMRAIALQAWFHSGQGRELTSEQRDACRRIGINPASREIDIDANFRYGDPVWTYGDGSISGRREVRAGLDTTTSLSAAGYTIPEGFMYELEKVTVQYATVRNVCKIIQTPTGNTLPYPVVTDTANSAAILAEAQSISTSVDPTFSAINFTAYKLSSKPVLVSNEIITDSAFNLASVLAELLGERFGRGEATYTTTGTNSSQPQGIVTAAGTGVTSGSATVITADEVLGLAHSLDPSYRSLPSVGFMMHDTALLYVRKLKDANGAYLWMPGLQAGVPDRLIGYPVSINQQMEPLVNNLPVTAKKHILFGAFEKYVIRDVAGVRFYHLQERYRDTDQDAFIAFKRFDARTINAAGLKVLLQA